MEECLRLNEAYQEQYRLTKDKLLTMPKGKQFDFSETQIFSKFDLFCRRIIKLIDMFSTIHQFNALADHQLEGMEGLIAAFFKIIGDFKKKRHELLDYQSNKFDRDYVEFNIAISDLEGSLQQFINQSFENITSIEQSLALLKKFQTILQRESLKNDLDSKFTVIFHNYGLDLTTVQEIYEKYKHNPPLARNMPPVAGNITWSRHLLQRIEEPMRRFESNPTVLATKDSRKIIKTYNKVARTLVAFEYLWYEAWCRSVETSKAGLQATLIIRHPDTQRLYVNFDPEILQLIREAKCLSRLGIDVPEAARVVMLQEDKFKGYFNELTYLLHEYQNVVSRQLPVTVKLLRPHVADIELKIRPGMVTLTWTSMNIDTYKAHVHSGLEKLAQLLANVNDIVENRIEKNLKKVTRTLLVDLPKQQSLALDEFVIKQEHHVREYKVQLQAKNREIEHAVENIIDLATKYQLDSHIEPVPEKETERVRSHYNKMMYTALLNCTRNSLMALKKRICSRAGSGFLFLERPFFEVDVQLAVPSVRLSPSLEDIQRAVNKGALAVLRVSKSIWLWGQGDLEESTATPEDLEGRRSFFEQIGKDVAIVKVALLLTGALYGTRNQVAQYLKVFTPYDWLWKDDMEAQYRKFMMHNPTIENFEDELKRFLNVEQEIASIPPIHVIGALSLNTANIKLQLRNESRQWKVQYSDKVHQQARSKLYSLVEYIRKTTNAMSAPVENLHNLRYCMSVLKEVRERESSIEIEISPMLDMYGVLDHYIPGGIVDKDEMDKKSIIRASWRKLSDFAEEVGDNLQAVQGKFRKKLLQDIAAFGDDVSSFRTRYVQTGPAVQGIDPKEAVVRLKRFKSEFDLLKRKQESYAAGEDLFALKKTEYPNMVKTHKELTMLTKLYDLYMDVSNTLDNYNELTWNMVMERIESMAEAVTAFDLQCKRLPKSLREWEAYNALSTNITNFLQILPLLQDLSKDSIQNRHWVQVMTVTGSNFVVDANELSLGTLLNADLLRVKDDIEDICDSADKQMAIDLKLSEVRGKWSSATFTFEQVKGKRTSLLKGYGQTIEDLEESQLALQTMLSMRHVGPFKDGAANMLSQLSDTADTLELWIKVQLLWQSLESVFTGGDIMKQMPLEAKKFSKIDKDWNKAMSKAEDTLNVVACCSNELLKNSLPIMYAELEKCQKSLEGYLEQKRSSFPRFYFVSNSVLLQILSRGSDYNEVQPYYEKLFDSVACAVHEDSKGSSSIIGFQGISGSDVEEIKLLKPVHVQGNIETWLGKLEKAMQETMKDTCERAADDCSEMELREFVDRYPGQFALLGIQFNWTTNCTEALDRCRSSKTAMQENNKRQLGLLSELSGWTLQDLGTKMNRRKMETLITVQVHQRDVFAELVRFYKERKVSSPLDFEWLKQARFYWNPDGTDMHGEGACVISICDVDFKYSHEYLGCKARLVITPLTDRAYITLSQALGMGLGGSPAGPAGTGKTETVKDLGATLGIFVIVTNCTDNHSYKDMAKIFKGLCQAGLWGCFDEFNRIRLPVLSVVAQQVLAITNAKRSNQTSFPFPGDSGNTMTTLNSVVGYFITMNPGYQGRQELPENLKILFRGVAMMVPDREIIIRVKLCSVGYARFSELARKFRVLYRLCEEQLSNQRHYDFGLRNILSVLRAAGSVKRQNVEKDEAQLLMGTLRNMNLSKLVAQDTSLFLSLLNDLFPGFEDDLSAMGGNEDVSTAIREYVETEALVHHPAWVAKVHQLDDTVAVRHGIMIIGPAGGGKSQIMQCLSSVHTKMSGIQHKLLRMNPKAIRADEMFGETDQLSGEWMDGVFASMWSKSNQRTNKFNTWLVCDGPVDAIWIENLNTVLDDNKILTLANGDRIPMTDNVKLMFEVENLNNASPATVSRAGIVYVSDTDLDWWPPAQAWIRSRPESERVFLEQFFMTLVGDPAVDNEGEAFRFVRTACEQEVSIARVGVVNGMCQLLDTMLERVNLSFSPSDMEPEIERLFIFALAWSVGGRLTELDRAKFDSWLREKSKQMPTLPKKTKGQDALTVYDFEINYADISWQRFTAPEWEFPVELDRSQAGGIDMAGLLIPTIDSHRAQKLIKMMHSRDYPVMLVGGTGTAKTVTALMFFDSLNSDREMVKKVALSYATSGGTFQRTIENELDKRGGKMFGPPGSKTMTVFLDDINMPMVNEWGDQPTLEAARQLIADGTFSFLDKDRRGDLKIVEDLRFVAAGNSPAGGKNDIPARLKRLFFTFNMIPPSNTTIDSIYGRILLGRYNQAPETASGKKKTISVKDKAIGEAARKTIGATIKLWIWTKKYFMPTPSKFHYIFNMRDLSRIFQGVMRAPRSVVKLDKMMVQLWRNECARVFGDKLATKEDKARFAKKLVEITDQAFGKGYNEQLGSAWFVDFLRDDVYDEDGVLVEEAPRVYDKVQKLNTVRTLTQDFLVRHNSERPNHRMDLVFFDDALEHLIRISRIIGTPRGNALLVGVGGSGKRSLTKLAAFISRQRVFEIQITKMYNFNSLVEDVAQLFRSCGQQGSRVTWIFTESHIKSEEFLEVVNSILMSGEVNNLFPKDELNLMVADLRSDMAKQRPDLEDTTDNLINFFTENVRKNLHLVLCMSPMNPKFAQRARKFPGMINGTMVDYFLAWPQSALEGVAKGIIDAYPDIESEGKLRSQLASHMGQTHATVMKTCADYKDKMRRYAHQTPKTFLSYMALYKELYSLKRAQVADKESRVLLGLAKLKQGGKDVEKMKIELAQQEEILLTSNQECTKMLTSLQVSSLEAKKESDAVGIIRDACESEAASIDAERRACEDDLAKAQPYLDDAETAVNSIKPADLNELKKLPKPSDIIKLIFDCVSILKMQPMVKVEKAPVTLGVGKDKKTFMFLANSYVIIKAGMLSDAGFLKSLFHFSQHEKDNMNDETMELVAPYLELEGFVPSVARNASKASEGLCAWVRAMAMYHHASKVVKPKLEKLQLAKARLGQAEKELEGANENLKKVKGVLDALQKQFDDKRGEKQTIENRAMNTRRKMELAQELIDGLVGERERWTEDSKLFKVEMKNLIGDVAIASMFLSYCGAFNQTFRETLVHSSIVNDLREKKLPQTSNFSVRNFLVDDGITGDWAMQGLPSDSLSIDNGILVTRASRYPLLIDPQGQGLTWVSQREKDRIPNFGILMMDNSRLRDHIEYAMAEGKALIIQGIEEEIDPLLDPLLEKALVKKGRSMYIDIGNKLCEFNDAFTFCMVSRLPNPHFSPEIQARTMVVDFTVTQLGLEEQMLGRVIQREQATLEEQLTEVLNAVNSNRKALLELDNELLQRLTANEGNLLDDVELISVLSETKSRAVEVKQKLVTAEETRQTINEKREQYRPVATRGSILYFSIVDMAAVNNMYQTSLAQFLQLFSQSMANAEKATTAAARVNKIVDTLTYTAYRNTNRGMYGRDRMSFLLIAAFKIMITAGILTTVDVSLFLKGGAGLDTTSLRPNPYSEWMEEEAYRNIVQLSLDSRFYSSILDDIGRSEVAWRKWYDSNEPERAQIPEVEARLLDKKGVAGAFLRLLIVRCLRPDRTILGALNFIRDFGGLSTTGSEDAAKQLPALGAKYCDPVTDTIEEVVSDSNSTTPMIYLLSAGSDPTDDIISFSRRKKTSIAVVSMGEGQAPYAAKAIAQAAPVGTWVLLQNCHLGLDFISGALERQLEALSSVKKNHTSNVTGSSGSGEQKDSMTKTSANGGKEDSGAAAAGEFESGVDPNFRLFLTTEPSVDFPISLLQMSMKVTNEPPAGLRAGLLHSYTSFVDQEKLERVDTPQYRALLFSLCFLHSTIMERRKFGALGWCIPYEFNLSDLSACARFLERHLYHQAVSWPTLQYIVGEVQYGGKITDDMDRRLFTTFCEAWLTPTTLSPQFTFNPQQLVGKIPDNFVYNVPDGLDVEAYRSYIQTFPDVDSPEMFGLHPNADMTYRTKEVNSLLSTIIETQPKSAAGSSPPPGGGVSEEKSEVDGGDTPSKKSPKKSKKKKKEVIPAPPTREDIVVEKAGELMQRLPNNFVEDIYREQLDRQGGLGVPLNIFALQEVQRMDNVITVVRSTLTQIQLAIRGEVTLTSSLDKAIDSIFDARVPKQWMLTPSGEELSWLSPNLGLWFTGLIDRQGELDRWLSKARPSSYWLTGFFNPQGFLTAMRQEVTRAHAADRWALDDVQFHTEVTEFINSEAVKKPAVEGALIHGLFLDGAAWSRAANTLVESEPKKLFATLPVLYVTAITSHQKKGKAGEYGGFGPAITPVYKYPVRQDRFLIFEVNLPTREVRPQMWILRGVALLCSKD